MAMNGMVEEKQRAQGDIDAEIEKIERNIEGISHGFGLLSEKIEPILRPALNGVGDKGCAEAMPATSPLAARLRSLNVQLDALQSRLSDLRNRATT